MKKDMKKTNPIVVLFVVTVVAGLLVGIANHITLPQILLHAEGALQGNLGVIFPQASEFEDKEILDDSNTRVYIAIRGSDVLGYVLITYGRGYEGAVQVFTGMNHDGTILQVVVGEHSETPGLGTRIEHPDFLDQFVGMTGPIRAVFTEPGDGEIANIAGVTISADAVVIGVNNALAYFNEHIYGR